MYRNIDFKLIASYKQITDIPTLQQIIKMLISYSKKLEIKLIIEKDCYYNKQLPIKNQIDYDKELIRQPMKDTMKPLVLSKHHSRTVTPNKNKPVASEFPFGKEFEKYIEKIKDEKVIKRKQSPLHHGHSQSYSFNLACKENKRQLMAITSNAKSKISLQTANTSNSLNSIISSHACSRNHSSKIGLTKNSTQSTLSNNQTQNILNLISDHIKHNKKETSRNETISLNKYNINHKKRTNSTTSSQNLKKFLSYTQCK